MVLEKLWAYQFEPAHLIIFLTLIYLEAVLSFDNAAVLAAMVRPLPPKQRPRALLYGLVGAYIFRVAAILGAAFIIANPWLKIVGGLYLLWLPLRHFWHKRGPETLSTRKAATLLGLNAFWSTVVFVELMDLAFALDQVLVAVALTDEILLIILASMTAILFLRIAASYMSRIMDWFPTLEDLAYVAVGFVGLKLLYEEVMEYLHACTSDLLCPVPKTVSVGVTLSLLVIPLIVKVGLDWVRRRSTG